MRCVKRNADDDPWPVVPRAAQATPALPPNDGVAARVDRSEAVARARGRSEKCDRCVGDRPLIRAGEVAPKAAPTRPVGARV